ncbi:glycosyltransferase [Azospirillum picis]|uniref:Glycosyltransferase n=1 Tax=Azospirillum picis TaxID=488438 RepID=A0ABU0MTM3_9PROT|nr:glycosyltransferase [Azospirillum picis]MBP2303074.1 hypothetical protein [Azospirillum picis]MDQ0536812.1 hypothetical protein [Azospirillum picis]
MTQAVAAKLLDLLPADAARVLEVCGADGALRRQMALRNPATTFVILEKPPAADPPDPAEVLGAAAGFDALVLHDVFVTVRSPFAMLAALLPCLRPAGTVLLVLPDGWCQERLAASGDQGLVGLLQRLLTSGPLEGSGLTVDLATRVAGQATGQPDEQAPRSVVILRVMRQAALRRLLVAAMTLRPVGACNDTRIDLPNGFLATVPGVRTQAGVNSLGLANFLPGEERIAVLQRRIAGRQDIANLRQLLRAGYLLVSEFDDHPDHWPAIGEQGYLTFRGVHAVQTSTDFLAGELRAHNPEVAVFPNQVATLPPPKPLLKPMRRDGRVVLFFGAFNRGDDWKHLMPGLNRLLAANRRRVGVQVVHDRAFFDALDTADKAFMPTCGYEGYIQALQRCDIGLLPLDDTLFNRSKSDLKYIECAAHGVAALASPVVYGDAIRDGETGVLFRSPEEFADRLGRLIEDIAWRTGMIEAAYRYVRDHRLMAQHFRKRLAWYRSLLARKEELDAGLYERVPELRP